MPRRNRKARPARSWQPGPRIRIQRGDSEHSPCRKRRWRSEEQALAAMADLISFHPRKVIPIRAYYHEWCGGWHLTSKPKWPEQEAS